MLTPNDLNQIHDIVHTVVHTAVDNAVDNAKKELKFEIKKSILREHKKTRALINMVIGDYDIRLIDHRKRLERIETHLDLPRIQN